MKTQKRIAIWAALAAFCFANLERPAVAGTGCGTCASRLECEEAEPCHRKLAFFESKTSEGGQYKVCSVVHGHGLDNCVNHPYYCGVLKLFSDPNCTMPLGMEDTRLNEQSCNSVIASNQEASESWIIGLALCVFALGSGPA